MYQLVRTTVTKNNETTTYLFGRVYFVTNNAYLIVYSTLVPIQAQRNTKYEDFTKYDRFLLYLTFNPVQDYLTGDQVSVSYIGNTDI